MLYSNIQKDIETILVTNFVQGSGMTSFSGPLVLSLEFQNKATL